MNIIVDRFFIVIIRNKKNFKLQYVLFIFTKNFVDFKA